ncbi:CGNR zinc finger domain-containing protein [Pseudonocardia alni subsp. carboxydivorans]|uniref:CGNR zinc finger domain-containing protein n=1 Tax=Pseudonocardia alni subsp. carboxydivorans TaxID=415010 RepID=A0ABU9AG28_PSEA5
MGFVFVSGSAALDLVGTVTWRRTDPTELLTGPADLARWIDACADLPDGVTVTPEVLGRARDLREAVHRLATDRLAGRAFDPAALAVVNGTARGPGMTVQLDDHGTRRTGDADAVLAELARDAVAVLADRGTPLKECGRPGCTRLYLDRSRGARRTWCGMDECGNRVKAAAYRARRRTLTG